MAKDDKKVKRGVYLYIDGKGIKNDVNTISLEIKRLQRDIKDMTIGSEKYNHTMAKIQHLKGILKEHRSEIRGVTEETKRSTLSLGKFADGFNRFGGVIVSVIGFLTGFALALRTIREERNKLESSQAGLKALTGLDDNSIAWLTAQAKTLSTTMTKEGLRVRQSAAEILDAFMLVGSAKPELLGDKEALRQVTEEAMRLQAAAGDITLNEAVDSLTLSLNQYGAAADQASRFVNVLAAGSKEGAVNIASQAKAIQKAGTMAATLNIPIEELVGSIEMLGEKGVKDEIAGTGLKTFFTRLATGATDTNPKIVGLANALDNLNKQVEAAEAKQAGGGTSLLKNIFGDEGMQTAMILTQNVEQVKKYTAAVTGTNIAYEQAAINSATAAAQLDQARNKMKLAAIELGEKLNPAFTISTNMMTNVIKILPGLIDWFQKWGVTIAMLLAPVLLYNSALKLMNLYHVASNTLMGLARILSLKLTIAKLAETTNFTRLAAATRLYNAELAKNNILVTTGIRISNALKAMLYSLQVVYYTLTFQMGKARGAMVAFNMVCAKNVYATIAAVVIGLATAIYLLATRTKKAKSATEEFYSAVGQERNELNKVYNQLLKTNEKTDERTRLINEFNGQFGKYLTNLLSEKSTVDDIKKAYREATVAMNDHYARELLASKQAEIVEDNLEKQSKYLKESVDIAVNATKEQKARLAELISDVTNQTITDNPQYGKGNVRQKIYEQINREFGSGAAYDLFGDSQGWEDFTKKINPFIDGVDETIKKTNELKDELAPFIKSLSAPLPDYASGNGNEKCPKCGNSPCTCKPKGTDKDDKDKFAKVEAEYYQRISAIKNKYLADDTMTQDQYSEQMQKAEMQLLNDKLDIAGLEPEKKQEIADKILDIQIKMKDKMRELTKKDQEDAKKTREKASEETFSQLDKEYQLKLEDAAMYHYKNRTSEDNYNKEMRRLQNDYYNSVLDNSNVSEEKKQEIRKQSREMQLEDAKKGYEKEIDDFNNMTNIVVDSAQLLQNSMADFFTSEEKDFGKFMGSILTILLDSIEKELIATQAAAIALITMKEITSKGWLGIATAAAKIVLIVAAFEGAKAILGNFYTGGYTGSGDWDQPQGIVHSNEFVANRYAVANPAVRPVLDLIDSAQRTGSIANLTNDDIAAVVSTHKSPLAIERNIVAGSGQQSADPALLAVLSECGHVMGLLRDRLNEPFITENTVVGRRGIKQAMDKYDSLMKNVSR